MERQLNKTIFFSYALEDREIVQRFQNALANSGFHIFSDYTEVPPGGASWGEAIQDAFESSDFIVVFLSKSLFNRQGLHFEYSRDFLNYVKMRNINLVPVKIDDMEVPPYFLEFELVDASKGSVDPGVLLQRVSNIADINFDALTPVQFENLVYALLQNLEFKNITWEKRQVENESFDFTAEHYTADPFGQRQRELWLIECKFYKQARFDLRSIKKIIDDYKYIRRKDAKLVLITNSQFNSVAQEFVESIQNTDFIDIKLIDGFQLKLMLSRFPGLIKNYFKA